MKGRIGNNVKEGVFDLLPVMGHKIKLKRSIVKICIKTC